jgi:D-amino-acid dehydrogenase
MKVAVLGGGVVGVATAYFLAEDGHEVTLIERRDRAAQETSRGNAGLVAPSDSYAWASPDALKTAVKSLWSPDMGIQYKLRLDPRLWLWSLRFFFQCTPAATHRNTLRKLRISSYSQQMLNQGLCQTKILAIILFA